MKLNIKSNVKVLAIIVGAFLLSSCSTLPISDKFKESPSKIPDYIYAVPKIK